MKIMYYEKKVAEVNADDITLEEALELLGIDAYDQDSLAVAYKKYDFVGYNNDGNGLYDVDYEGLSLN